MRIKFENNAENIVFSKKIDGAIPTLCVAKGGCAGWMFVLKMMPENQENAVYSGIAITPEAAKLTNDITIKVKSGICGGLIVINNSVNKKCKCGKSFVK